MTNRKGFAYRKGYAPPGGPERPKVRPRRKVQPAGAEADEAEAELPPSIRQDLAFCRAMIRAGYKLVELEKSLLNR